MYLKTCFINTLILRASFSMFQITRSRSNSKLSYDKHKILHLHLYIPFMHIHSILNMYT